ncbi:MAG: hypothetical protein LBN37_05535 [Bacteroidales bacterium]|jgi:hypothetical protein|nr:hypothetical protein [Bacteroidales bacterium]
MDTMIQETPPTTERIPGVEYDDNGKPVGYTIQEVFDELDRETIALYGESARKSVNEKRAEWNKIYPWKFDYL